MLLYGLLVVVTLATLLWWLLLWRREARRIGARPTPAMLAAGLLLPLIGAGLYAGFGHDSETREWLEDYRELRPLARELAAGRAPEELEADIPQGRIARVLQREMARAPTAEGWYALGLLYAEMEAAPAAVEAARRAVEREPSEHTRMLLARTLLAREGGALDDESRELLEQVLREHPDHDGAWMMLAMGATQAGDYERAVEAWEAMLERHDAGRAGPVLRRSLAFAREQMALRDHFAELEVTVDAPEELRAGGSLFVFVQREGGAGQPLAARRVLAERFPVTVTLEQEHWLQNYPDPEEALHAGARYSPAGGQDVGDAGYRATVRTLEPDEPVELELRGD